MPVGARGYMGLLHDDGLSALDDFLQPTETFVVENDQTTSGADGWREIRRQYLKSASILSGEDITLEYAGVVVFDEEYAALDKDLWNVPVCREQSSGSCREKIQAKRDDSVTRYGFDKKVTPEEMSVKKRKISVTNQQIRARTLPSKCTGKENKTSTARGSMTRQVLSQYDKGFVEVLRQQKIERIQSRRSGPFLTTLNDDGDVVLDLDFSCDEALKLLRMKKYVETHCQRMRSRAPRQLQSAEKLIEQVNSKIGNFKRTKTENMTKDQSNIGSAKTRTPGPVQINLDASGRRSQADGHTNQKRLIDADNAGTERGSIGAYPNICISDVDIASKVTNSDQDQIRETNSVESIPPKLRCKRDQNIRFLHDVRGDRDGLDKSVTETKTGDQTPSSLAKGQTRHSQRNQNSPKAPVNRCGERPKVSANNGQQLVQSHPTVPVPLLKKRKNSCVGTGMMVGGGVQDGSSVQNSGKITDQQTPAPNASHFVRRSTRKSGINAKKVEKTVTKIVHSSRAQVKQEESTTEEPALSNRRKVSQRQGDSLKEEDEISTNKANGIKNPGRSRKNAKASQRTKDKDQKSQKPGNPRVKLKTTKEENSTKRTKRKAVEKDPKKCSKNNRTVRIADGVKTLPNDETDNGDGCASDSDIERGGIETLSSNHLINRVLGANSRQDCARCRVYIRMRRHLTYC